MQEHEIRQQLEELHSASFGWALSCCAGNREEAEDVLQATYLKILSGKARFGGRSAFKTWLFSVIRLTAADGRRKHAIRWSGLRRLREQAAPPSSAPSKAVQEVHREELRDRFRALLRDLPGRQRQVIQLVFYHDHTLSEAAGVMGVSLGSARTHYHRGKKRLRDWLQEQAGDA